MIEDKLSRARTRADTEKPMETKLYDTVNGERVNLYEIKDGLLELAVCDMGARINALRVDGRDIVLGFNTVSDYVKSGSYAGATIGRVANRIALGVFTLSGKAYRLNTNNGKNHLHGGNVGFDKRLFTVTAFTENSITMRYVSADGEENYPGKLEFDVTFTLSENTLLIEFSAVSDKDTLWCPTNHAYFNLDGKGDCRTNLLQINADYITPVDSTLIPTGEKRAVSGTAFDFNVMKPIGADFENEQVKPTNGYDHNYILKSTHAAHAESCTGLKMDVFTDMPCLQLYTGGMLRKCAGKNDTYNQWAGFCLEPQFCPNAINMPDFAPPVLRAHERKTHYIKYVFSK